MRPQSARNQNSGTRNQSHLAALPPEAATTHALSRLVTLDLARGFAIALMIISHGVKGLISFEDFPAWGMVPIHLVTKFSSSLFILIFGITLSVSILPHVHTAEWPRKRMKLLTRALVVLFWYKMLTIVEMFHTAKPSDIWLALKYQAFPSYVEILGFYGIALLWVPFALSLWKISPWFVRLSIPVGFFFLNNWLTAHAAEVFSSPQMQALFIEHDDYYTWGQIARAPLIFVGLLIGDAIAHTRKGGSFPFDIPAAICYTGLSLWTVFIFYSWGEWYKALFEIALNKGKHPPELGFMLFSLGGAALILGLCLRAGRRWADILSPVALLGRYSLEAFVFHAVVLFVFYRFLFGWWLKVSYGHALGMALVLVAMSAAWVKVQSWVKSA